MKSVLLFTVLLIGCNEPYSTHDRELGRIMDFIKEPQKFNQEVLNLSDDGKGAIEDYWKNLDSWSIDQKARVKKTSIYRLKVRSGTGKEGMISVSLTDLNSGLRFQVWKLK